MAMSYFVVAITMFFLGMICSRIKHRRSRTDGILNICYENGSETPSIYLELLVEPEELKNDKEVLFRIRKIVSHDKQRL